MRPDITEEGGGEQREDISFSEIHFGKMLAGGKSEGEKNIHRHHFRASPNQQANKMRGGKKGLHVVNTFCRSGSASAP